MKPQLEKRLRVGFLWVMISIAVSVLFFRPKLAELQRFSRLGEYSKSEHPDFHSMLELLEAECAKQGLTSFEVRNQTFHRHRWQINLVVTSNAPSDLKRSFPEPIQYYTEADGRMVFMHQPR